MRRKEKREHSTGHAHGAVYSVRTALMCYVLNAGVTLLYHGNR